MLSGMGGGIEMHLNHESHGPYPEVMRGVISVMLNITALEFLYKNVADANGKWSTGVLGSSKSQGEYAGRGACGCQMMEWTEKRTTSNRYKTKQLCSSQTAKT